MTNFAFDFDPDFFDIDPLFTSRRPPTDAEIEEIISRFIDETLSVAEAEAAFKRLGRAKRRVQPRLLAMIASPDPEIYNTATVLISQLKLKGAIKPLRQLLEDPNLDDDHKIGILHTLQVLGGLSPDEDPFTYLRDPERMIRKSQEAILSLLQDPLELERMLQAILERDLPIAEQPEMLMAMASSQDQRVLPLLLCLLHAPDDKLVLGAIEALKIFQDPTTVAILEERARYDPSKKVRGAAEEAVTYLKSQAPSRPASIFELPVAPPPLVRCLISTIDGNGGQVLLIVRQADDGTFPFLDLMFNDHEGIKDCFGGLSGDEDEAAEVMIDGLGEMGIEMVEISLERARTELERAYQITLQARRRLPPSYMSWRSWLQGEDREPVETFPLPQIADEEQVELLQRCGELLELDEFDSWFFNPEELHGLEREFEPLAKRPNTDQEIEALIRRGIGLVVDDPRRRLLRERLERQAWLLTQLYVDEEIPKLALAAAAGLADDADLPLEEHPLLHEMMFASFLNAIDW